eukprot:TRINITY_DN24012_c0_g1_i4.p2 TRINITY_DN24012_c0_g1~~TRINITY_DN24012_c0_g1_i4.p2  ORF type:complete len:188 (+),score=30.60 TRINITY_DN24012_c0_g1_i4:78-566(+)
MAKWGQGDPRWLVAEREDGKNVNSWHWEEVNKLEWCKDRLQQLLEGLETAQYPVELQITKLADVKGEAFLTRRKGNKKFAVYDLTLEMKWEGKLEHQQDQKAKGKLRISEFASSLEQEDYVFDFTCDDSSQLQGEVGECVDQLKEKIYDKLDQLVLELNGML